MTTRKRDLLLHPDRLRMVQSMVNQPMTAAELLSALGDVSQATLYRHLKMLLDGGLLEIVNERPVRGGVERTYRTVQSAVMLDYDDIADASPDDHFRFFATFVGTLLAEYGRYLDGEIDLENDRIGYTQTPLWLTPEEFDAFAEELRSVIASRLENGPTPGRRRHLLNTIVLPGDR